MYENKASLNAFLRAYKYIQCTEMMITISMFRSGLHHFMFKLEYNLCSLILRWYTVLIKGKIGEHNSRKNLTGDAEDINLDLFTLWRHSNVALLARSLIEGLTALGQLTNESECLSPDRPSLHNAASDDLRKSVIKGSAARGVLG